MKTKGGNKWRGGEERRWGGRGGERGMGGGGAGRIDVEGRWVGGEGKVGGRGRGGGGGHGEKGDGRGAWVEGKVVSFPPIPQGEGKPYECDRKKSARHGKVDQISEIPKEFTMQGLNPEW